MQQGYSRVSTDPGGTLSNSTTSTSLDTVIDTSTDNISNSPRLQKQKPRTIISPILESDDPPPNPFAEDIRGMALKKCTKININKLNL